jgi:Tfp pilus assembly protein PilO
MMDARLRLVLGIALAAGVVAALWLLSVAPKREEAATLGAQVAQAELRLADANARAATAEQARATYARDYATVARLGKAVPVAADVPSLVYQLESAARASKVDFRSVSAPDVVPDAPAAPGVVPTPGGGIKSAPFSFKFEGDYFSLQKLLARIDGFSRVKGTQVAVNGRLLTIDGLTLNPASGGLPRVQGVVSARAYVADLPDPLPAAAATTVATSSQSSQGATP